MLSSADIKLHVGCGLELCSYEFLKHKNKES